MSITLSAKKVWRNYVTDGDSGSGAHAPIKADIQVWGQEVEQREFDTRTALIADTMLAGVNIVHTGGYATAGDGGGATYKRVGSEPSHALKAQSADATWWEYVYSGSLNILQTGAVADDGSTDNSTAIQGGLDFLDDRGGGVLFVPANNSFYGYTIALSMPSYTTIQGEGYKSHLKNTVTSPSLETNHAIFFGNYGSWGSAIHANGEVMYDLNSLTSGERDVQFVTGGDSANFAVGDVVFIWDPEGTTNFEYMQTNEVIAVNAGELILKYPHPFNVVKSGAADLVVSINGKAELVSAADGRAARMIVKSHLYDLRITQAQTNGRICISFACYESSVERCKVTGFAPLSATGFAWSSIKDCDVLFYSTPVEMAQLAGPLDLINNNYTPVLETQSAAAAILLNSGGYGVRIIGGTLHKCKIQSNKEETEVIGVKVYNSPGTSIQVTSTRGGDIIRDNYVKDPTFAGIDVSTPNTIVMGNRIEGIPSGQKAIALTTSSSNCTVVGNIVQTQAGVTVRDIIKDDNGSATTNKFSGNMGANSHNEFTQFVPIAHTGTVSTTIVASRSFAQDTLNRWFHIEILAAGFVDPGSTANTKVIKVKVGSTVLSTLSFAAGETGGWEFNGRIFARNGLSAQRCLTRADSEQLSSSYTMIAMSVDTAAGALQVDLEMTLGDTGDSVTLTHLNARVVNDQFEI